MNQLDPSVRLRSEPMTSFQMVAVVVCVALNALDGFDILAITFAGPGITREWGLGPGALGIVISTGLVGMTIGSLGIAPLASQLMTTGTELPGSPPQWVGAVVLVAYAVVTGIIGTLIVRRRDIS